MNGLLRLRPPSGQPILIVGNGRSGTSWIGESLAQAPGVIYYREPCNPSATGVADDTVWSRFVPAGGHDRYFEKHLNAAFRGLTSRRYGAGGIRFVPRLLGSHRVIVKEVATFPSIEWVYNRWKPMVLMVVRHPCDCALSVKKAGLDATETSRLRDLLSETSAAQGYLEPYIAHLASARTPLEVSTAIWAAKNFLALDARSRHPEWMLVRYEDLCAEPVDRFRSLYAHFQLGWTDEIEHWIRKATEEEVPGTYSTRRIAALQTGRWRKELDAGEVEQVRRMVEPFKLPFYAESKDWEVVCRQ